jgi:putative ABC transport system permease protein
MLRGLFKRFSLARAVVGTSLRGVAANRTRAFLSTLGIAIGVATLMAIYALIQGLTTSFTQQIAQLGSNTLYVSSRPWIIRGDWWKYRNRPPITRDDIAALRAGGDKLTAIAPVSFAGASVAYMSERVNDVGVRGTTADFLETTNIKLETGRFLSPIDEDMHQQVAVIGADVKDVLFKGGDPLGAKVYIGNRQFTVVGTLKPQGKSFGQSMDRIAIVPLSAFGRTFGMRRHMMIAVTSLPEHSNEAEDQVTEILRRRRGLAAFDENNFAINRQSELVKMFNEQTAAIFGVAITVGLITLLVGGIGVMNIMLVAVTERTREIGVRRALGARRRTILAQFLIEASLVTLMGGIVGTAAGLGGAKVISLISPLEATASLGAALGGLIFSAIVGLIFGVWPAYRAAQLDPIESLRYE